MSHIFQLKGRRYVMRKMVLIIGLMFIVCGMVLMLDGTSIAGSGNPKPGYPKDTIVIHIKKEHDETFNSNCEGGHSLHIGATQDENGYWHPEAVTIEITMKDWVLLDNDEDGQFDEDPLDGVDQDGDGSDGEDPMEPNYETFATDCDSRAPGDNTVAIQIGDKDPDKGEITAQSWFIRLNGPPQQPLLLETSGKHAYECKLAGGPDGVIGTADDVIECTYETDNIPLGHLNIKDYCGGIAFKEGGKNKKGGGKTSFCDITDLFLVDYDVNNDGVINDDDASGSGVHIFSTTCYATFGISTDEDPIDGIDNDGDGLVDEDWMDGIDNDGDETGENCPLSSAIWNFYEQEDGEKTGRPLIKLFVIHDEANVPIRQTKKIQGHNNK